ncbi:MAG: SRPBCC family protein [Bacteroidia bacterium]|nr:SRPBCC family protein [Bacteroidia bacterium]
MKLYYLERKQKFIQPPETIWKFISNPKNLAIITPPYLKFVILTPDLPEKIYPGQIIEYIVSPYFNIPIRWITEITAVHENRYFIDEQKHGPYTFWHHEHWLFVENNCCVMQDKVLYSLPFSPISNLFHSFSIRKKLDEIFDYRYQKLYEIFPQK